jgi:hypothetical protein
MDRSILTTTLSATSDPDFRFLTAGGHGAETTSQPMIFLLSIARQLVLSFCSGPRDYYHLWMRLWAGRLNARLSPGHHSDVIVLCFIVFVSSALHVILIWTNKS